MDTVLVTGAGGFIGQHTVETLRQHAGCTVIGSTRDGRSGTAQLDLRDETSIRTALDGVTAIVHCAVGDRAVTVDGTRSLLRCAAASGIRRVVHISTMSVYGGAQGRVAEDTPMVSADGEGYAAWKAEAERICLEQQGLEIVRLRPTHVYGPRGTWWLGEMARRVRSGRWPNLGAAGEGTANMVYVGDVAVAIAAALVSEEAAGQAFNVNGPQTITWNGWFAKLAEVTGSPAPVPISPLGLKLRMTLALPLKAAARVRPGSARNLLTGVPSSSELGLFAGRAFYPTDLATAVMGWSPAIDIDQGLALSQPWLSTQALAEAA